MSCDPGCAAITGKHDAMRQSGNYCAKTNHRGSDILKMDGNSIQRLMKPGDMWHAIRGS